MTPAPASERAHASVFFSLACMPSHNVRLTFSFPQLSEPAGVLPLQCCRPLVHLCTKHCGLEKAIYTPTRFNNFFSYFTVLKAAEVVSSPMRTSRELDFVHIGLIANHGLLVDWDCTLKCIRIAKVNHFRCRAEK